MKHIFLLIVFSLFAVPPGNCAENRQADKSLPARELFGKYQRISIACPRFNPPHYYIDENGTAVGLFTDIWRLWSEKTGIQVDFISSSWTECLDMVRDGVADVHIGLFPSEKRDRFLDYAVQLGNSDIVVFYQKSVFDINTLPDLLGFRTGVIRNSLAEEYLRSNLPGAVLIQYPDLPSMLDAAEKKEIRVFVNTVENTRWYMEKKGILDNYRFQSQNPLVSRPLFAAVRKGNSDLTLAVQEGMARIPAGERSLLEQKWLGGPNEKEGTRLHIAIHNAMPPMSFMNADGEPVGMVVDIWRLWAKKTGREIEFYPSGWKQSLDSLRNGETDIHSGLFYSEERKRWMAFSQAYYEIAANVFFQAGQGGFSGLKELAGQKVGVVSGAFHEMYLRKGYPELKIVTYPSTEALIPACRNGEIRAFLAIPHLTSILLTRLGMSGEFDSIPEYFCSRKFHAAVLKENTELLKLVDDGLNAISNAELAKIEARWIPDPAERYYPSHSKDIRFTAAEKSWIQKHRVIRMGDVAYYPPMTLFADTGEYRGIFAEYARLVSERTGIRIETVKLEWPKVLEQTRNRSIDMFSGTETVERQEYADFTRPYFTFPNMIINRTETPFIRNIEDLRGKKVAVEKDFAMHLSLQKDYPELMIVPAADTLEALRFTSLGRSDAYIGNMVVAAYLIRQHKISNLKIAAPSGYPDEQVRYAVRSDWPELKNILDKTIASISKEEHDEIFRKWVPVRFEHSADTRLIWQWIMGVSAFLGLILAMTVFWNRRLSGEIEERKRAEAFLLEAEKETRRLHNLMKNIIDSMPSVLLGVNESGRITHWNRKCEEESGISAENALGKNIMSVFPRLAEEMENIRSAIRVRQPYQKEKVLWQTENENFWVDITVYPLITEGLTGGAVIRVDHVTQRVRMEEMMIQTEKMMSVGGLAAGMAHEINNPLGGILQSIQNIIRRVSPELPANEKVAAECGTDLDCVRNYLEQRSILRFLEGIKISGEKAAAIVSNMLTFSRRSESRMVSTDPAELLEKTLELASNDYDLKKKYDFRQIEIIRDFEPGLPKIVCTETEIEQVILNLLRNAAQSMSEGKTKDRKSRITLRLRKEEERIRMEVEDNGPGMDEKIRKRVFEPFFTTKSTLVGTGLGLSVSYFIISNNHRGTMEVESAPGRGAKFIIRIPIHKEA